MTYKLENVRPAVDRDELPDRLRYRWTNEGEYEVRFWAGTADELADRGLDALVEARRESAQHRHDGGSGREYTRYPRLYLHVEAPPHSARWVRVGHAGGITRWENERSRQDDTDFREKAGELHQTALAWTAHAMNLGRMASEIADEVRE